MVTSKEKPEIFLASLTSFAIELHMLESELDDLVINGDYIIKIDNKLNLEINDLKNKINVAHTLSSLLLVVFSTFLVQELDIDMLNCTKQLALKKTKYLKR